jgi:hypothetical protein
MPLLIAFHFTIQRVSLKHSIALEGEVIIIPHPVRGLAIDRNHWQCLLFCRKRTIYFNLSCNGGQPSLGSIPPERPCSCIGISGVRAPGAVGVKRRHESLFRSSMGTGRLLRPRVRLTQSWRGRGYLDSTRFGVVDAARTCQEDGPAPPPPKPPAPSRPDRCSQGLISRMDMVGTWQPTTHGNQPT